MMTIAFNENTYENVPEDYSELSLGKFMLISEVDQKLYKSQTEWTIQLVSIIIGCPINNLMELPISDLTALISEFEWVTEMPKQKPIKSIVIDGINYVTKEQTQLTTGEWISVESFLTEELTNQKNFHLVLAILLRPEVDGKIKPLESDFNEILKRAELFKQKMMIEDCYGLIQNFSNGARKSILKISKASSIQKEQRSQN
jgi:hypothetical protein